MQCVRFHANRLPLLPRQRKSKMVGVGGGHTLGVPVDGAGGLDRFPFRSLSSSFRIRFDRPQLVFVAQNFVERSCQLESHRSSAPKRRKNTTKTRTKHRARMRIRYVSRFQTVISASRSRISSIASFSRRVASRSSSVFADTLAATSTNLL